MAGTCASHRHPLLVTAEEADMTTTTHRAITHLTARLVLGALVLVTLILMGVAVTQAHRPAGHFVDSRP